MCKQVHTKDGAKRASIREEFQERRGFARVHAHITLANADKAFGGHLEPDTTVFTFAVVTGVLDDGLGLTKIDDWTYR
jgi:predicted DNA-binding protein with PD1-like motif